MYIMNSLQQKERNMLSYTFNWGAHISKGKRHEGPSNANIMDGVCGAHFSLHPNSHVPSCQVKGHLGT